MELHKHTHIKPTFDFGKIAGDRLYTTGTGQALSHVHMPEECWGSYCCIHNPSDHLMKDWPTHMVWRRPLNNPNRGGYMTRMCPHDLAHPDPDDPWSDFDHDCDGCCQGMGPDDEDEL